MPPYGRWTYSGLSGQNTVQAGTFCLRHSARTDILFRTFFVHLLDDIVLFLDYIVLFPYFVALFTYFLLTFSHFWRIFSVRCCTFSSLFPFLRFLVYRNSALFSTFRPPFVRHRSDISTFLYNLMN